MPAAGMLIVRVIGRSGYQNRRVGGKDGQKEGKGKEGRGQRVRRVDC